MILVYCISQSADWGEICDIVHDLEQETVSVTLCNSWNSFAIDDTECGAAFQIPMYGVTDCCSCPTETGSHFDQVKKSFPHTPPPPPEPPEAQLIHTLSKFHCLIHELCPTSHSSSLEHATYGTSCLPLAFLILTTCHPSNPRSINLI